MTASDAGMTAPAPADVVIGIDVGTSSVKGVACRLDGTVVTTAWVAHDVERPRPGWVEQDAEDAWWGDTARVARDLCAALGREARIAAVAVTTLGPALVPVDAAGRALRPGILYGIDTRATDEIALLESTMGRAAIRRRTGGDLSSQSVGPKVVWVVRHEPAVAARAASWQTATAFVVGRLTGEPVIDHHQAAAFRPFVHRVRRDWVPTAVEGIDLTGRLPRRAWPGDVAGRVTAAAARQTSLPEGTPVLVGTSDGPMEAHGLGATDVGCGAITYGSTLTLSTFQAGTRRPRGLWSSDGWAPDTSWFGGGLSASGSALAWLDRLTGAAATTSASPAGARRLLALPSFNGERTPLNDPSARGIIAGLTLDHDAGDLRRAIVEGLAFGVRELLDTLAGAGVRLDRLRASGGGVRDRILLQVVSDVTGLPQDVAAEPASAAYGAARLAASVAMRRPTEDWFRPAERILPDATHGAMYDERYRLARRLRRDARSVVRDLVAGADS